MLQYLNQKRAQSTLEYAVLIIVIIGALLSIQVYIKRGIQGRLKSATDDIGDQYSDGNTNQTKTTKTHSQTRDFFGVKADGTTKAQGVSLSKLSGPETTNTTDNMAIINVQGEYWGKD